MGDDDKDQKIEYDANFKGPMEDRKCTDIFFCIIFVVFWGGMIVVAALGLANGVPARYVYPEDYLNLTCGLDNSKLRPAMSNGMNINFLEKKYLYLPNPLDKNLQVCIEKCPGKEDGRNLANTVTPFPVGAKCDDPICDYGYTKADGNYQKIGGGDAVKCWCPYPTTSYLWRCVPQLDITGNDTTDAVQALENTDEVKAAKNKAYAVLGDVARVWWWILVCLLIAALLCFIYLFLLKIFAKFMVWATVFLVVIIFAGLSAYIWINATSMATAIADKTAQFTDPDAEQNVQIVQGFAIGLSIFTFLLICAILFMRKRINLAVQVIKEASEAVRAMPTIIFFPLIMFLVVLLFLVYWVAIALFLFSAKTYNPATGNFEQNEQIQYASLYHIFGLFWTSNFLIAVSMMSISGAVAGWYWTLDKSNMPERPVASAVKRTLRYHLGSLAFGSLILAIVQFIRFMLTQLEAKMKGKENKAIKFIFRCLHCCFACVERFLRFLNRNAYIMISVHGYSFCAGARRAFSLIMRNILRIAAVNIVGDFLLFLGKLMIVAVTGFIGMVYLRGNPDLRYWMIPWVFIILLSYVVSSGFMSLYELAIDTILLSFLEDSERNDGSSEKPYFMSESLKSFIESNEKKQAD